MGELLKDRILKTVGNEQAMEASRSAFAREVDMSRPSFQSLMDCLETEDLLGFHQSLQVEVDRPSFDASFEIACRNNPSVASEARIAALRGGSVIPGRGASPMVETSTDLFFIPVTGRDTDIRTFLADAENLRRLERVFADAGVLRTGATLTLSEAHISPESAINATPGGVRALARAFEAFNVSRGSSVDREKLEHRVDDFVTVCDGNSGPRTGRGVSTVLLVGSYAREYNLAVPIEIDALTAQVTMNDFGDDNDHILEGLTSALSEVSGFTVGRPAWLGRACADAAVQNVKSILAAEASFYGLNSRENGYDGIAMAQRGDSVLVEATLEGVSLGPVPYSSALAILDPVYPGYAFGAIAKEEIPGGHLEHGRSAYLN